MVFSQLAHFLSARGQWLARDIMDIPRVGEGMLEIAGLWLTARCWQLEEQPRHGAGSQSGCGYLRQLLSLFPQLGTGAGRCALQPEGFLGAVVSRFYNDTYWFLHWCPGRLTQQHPFYCELWQHGRTVCQILCWGLTLASCCLIRLEVINITGFGVRKIWVRVYLFSISCYGTSGKGF